MQKAEKERLLEIAYEAGQNNLPLEDLKDQLQTGEQA